MNEMERLRWCFLGVVIFSKHLDDLVKHTVTLWFCHCFRLSLSVIYDFIALKGLFFRVCIRCVHIEKSLSNHLSILCQHPAEFIDGLLRDFCQPYLVDMRLLLLVEQTTFYGRKIINTFILWVVGFFAHTTIVGNCGGCNSILNIPLECGTE